MRTRQTGWLWALHLHIWKLTWMQKQMCIGPGFELPMRTCLLPGCFSEGMQMSLVFKGYNGPAEIHLHVPLHVWGTACDLQTQTFGKLWKNVWHVLCFKFLWLWHPCLLFVSLNSRLKNAMCSVLMQGWNMPHVSVSCHLQCFTCKLFIYIYMYSIYI